MARYYIGTSGWHYDDWRGKFYPEKLPKNRWLDFYTQHFPTVELNYTFYRLPTEKAVTAWYDSSPADFFFAVKVSRYITHMKKLKDGADAMALFMSRISPLKEKTGPLLYQLPFEFQRDDERLSGFLSVLSQKYKHVFEFRDKSWYHEEVYSILRKYGAGFCIFDMPGLTSPVVATADFAYIRFHGKDDLYTSKYDDKDLSEWADKISKLAKQLKEVFIYFNNDTAGYALDNAVTLKRYLEKPEY